MALFKSRQRPREAVLFHVWTGQGYFSTESNGPLRDLTPLLGVLRDLEFNGVPDNFHVHVTDEDAQHLETILAEEIPAELWIEPARHSRA